MKVIRRLLLISMLLMGIYACKDKSEPMPEPEASPDLFEAARLLQETKAQFFSFAENNGVDFIKALLETKNWLEQKPDVQNVIQFDNRTLRINMKSGMATNLQLDILDDNGLSTSRGGGGIGGKALKADIGGKASQEIKNKKILFWNAGELWFYSYQEHQRIYDLIDGSPIPLELTIKKNDKCIDSDLRKFKDYGLVFINSHGFPDGIQSGMMLRVQDLNFKDAREFYAYIEAKFGKETVANLQNGMFTIGSTIHVKINDLIESINLNHELYISINITADYIKTIGSLSNTIVVANFCYSGSTVPIETNTTAIRDAFLSLNPLAYYCYTDLDKSSSSPLDNLFCKAMEDSFVNSLVQQLDSTGNAYLNYRGEQFMDTVREPDYFNLFGSPNFSYGCDLYDSRDGERYCTVKIGQQIWMAENLRYKAAGSVCYNDKENNCDIYGRMYTWAEVMNGAFQSRTVPSGVRGVCPQGWHIPSRGEMFVLSDALGAVSKGGAMKSISPLWQSPNVGASNKSRFSALPGGMHNGSFWTGLGVMSAFWHSNERDEISTNDVSFMWVERANDELGYSYVQKEYSGIPTRMACRCVKD